MPAGGCEPPGFSELTKLAPLGAITPHLIDGPPIEGGELTFCSPKRLPHTSS